MLVFLKPVIYWWWPQASMEQEEATKGCEQWISKENPATSGRAIVLPEMWSCDHLTDGL